MTAREMYEYALIECNKLEAPSLLLEDYNYFINKAVQQYINTIYNRYDINQQSTDDLRVLKTSAIIPLFKGADQSEEEAPIPTSMGADFAQSALFGASFIGELPKDYLHMLNCIVEYEVNHNFKCYNASDRIQFAARRLTSDMFSGILNNAYMRPMYKRPYYYVNNWNKSALTWENGNMTGDYASPVLPTNDPMDKEILSKPNGTGNTLISQETTSPEGYGEDTTVDSVRKIGRNANVTKVLLEIRFGKDSTLFTPKKAYVDYLKGPQFIRLTQAQIDTTVDTSQILEFPDYVCFEIVNIFTKLLLENASDPRLQTNLPINNTIASGIPQQQQAPQQQGQ